MLCSHLQAQVWTMDCWLMVNTNVNIDVLISIKKQYLSKHFACWRMDTDGSISPHGDKIHVGNHVETFC